MRDVFHKTSGILKGRGKRVCLREHAQEEECVIDVCKHFIYLTMPMDAQQEISVPQVHVTKSFDSARRDEKFIYRVKGFFYAPHGRDRIKVAYAHTLRINVHWKSNMSTPKKIVTMA